jgi:copper transport protein
MGSLRRGRDAAGAALLALALLLSGARGAWAHAALLSSEPAEGSVLSASPARIRIVFSEPLEPALGRIGLMGEDGVIVPLRASGDPGDVHALVAATGALAPGGYRVIWRVVSADGHPVEGSFAFTVGAAPARPVPLPPELSAAELSPAWGPSLGGAPLIPSVLRGLAVGATMALAGLLFFLWRGGGSRRGSRLALGLAFAAPLLLALHLAAWLVNAAPEHRLGGDWLTTIVSTALGRVELWRLGLALLALWALGLAGRVRLALGFAATAVLVSGATGHAAAVQPALATPMKALHLAAIAVWLGGILWLASMEGDDPAVLLRAALRVSAAALAAVLVVALTGVVQTVLFLPSLLDLFRSAYGWTTLAKVAGLMVLAAFGARHRYRLLPRLAAAQGGGELLRSVRAEVAVMLLVVLIGGFLAYVPPPSAPPPARTPAGSPSHIASR